MAFLETLRKSGLVTDPDVLEAMAAEPRAPHHPPEYAPLTAADIPVPTHYRMATDRPSPSPTVVALLLQMAELETGLRVAVLDGDPYTLALARRLVGPSRVAGEEVLFGAAVQPPYDRVLVTVGGVERLQVASAKNHIADGGFALVPRYGPGVPEVVKILRSGGEFLEMRVTSLGAPAVGIHTGDVPRHSDFSRALSVDRYMQDVWTGRGESPQDRHFAEVVAETFKDPKTVAAELPAEPFAGWEVARKAFGCAYVHQAAGALDSAVDAYRASLAVHRTAEAHTFLGWTYSFQGHVEEAIQECHRAIAADPSFGNPYNDIGAYLLELGRPEEATPWFEKAKTSTRYGCYFFAHTNLARAYLLQGMRERARRELQEAVEKYPEYEPAREMLRQLDRHGRYFG